MSGTRPERVANAIRKEISSMIQQELKDPRIGFTTITKVEITSDLRNATIYYTVMGSKKEKKSTDVALNRAKGFIKNKIGDNLQLRLTPDLIFVYDKSVEYRDKIENIFDKLHEEEKNKK